MIKRNKKITLKNNAPFRSCISKIYNTFRESAEYLILLCQGIICWNKVTIIP